MDSKRFWTSARRGAVLRSVGIGVAVAALAAGCSGNSDNKASDKPSGGASSSSPALTGTPIKIGVIGTLTGPQASSGSQVGTVAPAWAKWVNANGGLNGHPVETIVEDDASDPAKAQAAAKKLLDQDQVLALVVTDDSFVGAYDADAIAKGVPVISGNAYSADWYTKPGMFPTSTDIGSQLVAQLAVAKQLGHATKFAALYCSEIAACGGSIPPQKAQAPKLGLGFTSLAVSSSATSYTAQCLQLQKQKVDYAQLNISVAVAAKFIQDCQAQNYNPTWGTSGQAIGPDLLKISGITVYGPDDNFPSVADAPAAATFRDAMGKYAKDDNWKEGTGGPTWDALEVLRKALATAGPSPTRADALAGLYTIKADDLGGQLANKITFTKGKANGFGTQPCYFAIGIKDQKTIAPNGATPVCLGA